MKLNDKGFTLIETMLALTILSAGIVMVMSNMNTASKQIPDIRNEEQAIELSESVLNNVREELLKLPLNKFKNITVNDKKPQNITALDINELPSDLKNTFERKVDIINHNGNNEIKKIITRTEYNNRTIKNFMLVSSRKNNPIKGSITGRMNNKGKVTVVETGETKEIPTGGGSYTFKDLITSPQGTTYHLKYEGKNQDKRIKVKEITLKPTTKDEITNFKVKEKDVGSIALNDRNLPDKDNPATSTSTIQDGNFNIRFPQTINYDITVDNGGEWQLLNPDGNYVKRINHPAGSFDPIPKDNPVIVSKTGVWQNVFSGDVSGNVEYKKDTSIPYIRFNETKNIDTSSYNVTVKAKDGLSGISYFRYRVNQSKSTPGSLSTVNRDTMNNWATNYEHTFTINDKGVNYIHIKVIDFGGNQTNIITEGPFILK